MRRWFLQKPSTDTQKAIIELDDPGNPMQTGLTIGVWDTTQAEAYVAALNAAEKLLPEVQLCEGECHGEHQGPSKLYYAYIPKRGQEGRVVYCDRAAAEARDAGFTVTRI